MSTEYYIPGNFAGYNAGSAQFTPGNLIPGGGNTENYNPASPGNTYNPPSIVGYNAPTGTSNPIYSPGVCATYTGNNIATYNAGNISSYSGNFVATYNALGTENYTPGNIASYTGNNVSGYNVGSPASYTGNFASAYNPAGTESYNAGAAQYNTGSGATYNTGSADTYNSPTITGYNPPTITGYNPPSGGGGGCCFAGDTLITMADLSVKEIETIEVGDEILSYNPETAELETNEVSQIITRVNRVMFEYILQNGVTIRASDDHPFFVVGKGYSSMNPELTMQGYRSLFDVAQVQAGDSFIDKDGNPIQINQIVSINYPFTVYTFNNKNKSSPNFFANGVLTY